MTEKKLTPQQRLFCHEYLKDLNASAAAVRAKYSEASARSIASELMAKHEIQDEIQKGMDKRVERLKVDSDYVLQKIQETIERCSQGEPVFEWDPEEKRNVPTGEWKFAHQGVLKGCELLGRHLKLFTDKVEHSGKMTLEDLVAGSSKPKDKE